MLINKIIAGVLLALCAVLVMVCNSEFARAEISDKDPSPTPVLVNATLYESNTESSGGVMGTSVIVTEPVNELDITKVETSEFFPNERISAKVTLKNLTSSDKQIDKAVLVVKKLDGTIETSKSIDANEKVLNSEETEIYLEFPGDLAAGKYVGVFELYSQGSLLGSSDTVLSVSALVPAVLGVSTIYNDSFLFPTTAIFAGILFFSVVILLNKKTLFQKGIHIKLFGLFVVIGGISAFGLGVSGGYLLSKTLFPSANISAKEQMSTQTSNETSQSKGTDIEQVDGLVSENGHISLYTKPDDSAEVSYKLGEDASFKIIDEAAGWFRVQLEDGRHGWVKIKDVQRVVENN